MQKHSFLVRIALLPILYVPSACGWMPGSEDPGHYIIDVTGAPVTINCSKSYTFAGHYANAENDTVSLAVSAGDLIYFQLMGEEILCYRYKPSDGLHLSIRFDSTYERFYLNDGLISVRLSGGSAAWDWLRTADDEILTGIRSLYITMPLSEAEINSLEMLSRVISNPGLFIEGDSLPGAVLTHLKPEWLIAEDLDYSTLRDDARANLRHLELLWHSGAGSIDPELLYGLPALGSLIIEYWDSAEIADLQFKKLRNLESLSIIESNIHDLSPVAAASGIRNLNLIYCDSLEKIGSAAGLKGLSCLGFTGCQHIRDIPAIAQMAPLTRLSLPGNTSQPEFADIISRHGQLQVLELVGCESITDLSPLEDLSALRALTLDLSIADLKPVCQLNELELLVLSEDLFEDSLAMAEIRRAMPGTRIVAGGGFCLGSGWILLLVPAVIILIMARNRFTGLQHARARR